MSVDHLAGVRRGAVPSGYRQVSQVEQSTEKGLLVTYYSWHLWVPKKCAMVSPGGEVWVQAWAIDSAKERAKQND